MEATLNALLQQLRDLAGPAGDAVQNLMDAFGPHIPSLQQGLVLTATLLPLLALLVLAGLPVLCVTGETLARQRGRSFYDKCARQLAVLGQGLAWVSLAAGFGLLWLRLGRPTTLEMPPLPELLCWALTGAGALCMTCYVLSWRILRSWPWLHGLLGLSAALAAYLAVYTLLLAREGDALAARGLARTDLFPDMLLPAMPGTWGVAACMPLLSLCLAGGMGTLWLLARRHRDDYGRDYYNLMLPWCAAWARNAWICLWLLLLATTLHQLQGLWYAQGHIFHQTHLVAAAQLVFWCLPALLWTPVLRSAVPLRHKCSLVLAFLLAVGFLAFLCSGGINL